MPRTHELHPPNPNATLSIHFNPTERMTEQMISDITAADTPLTTIARRAGTTLQAITLWMTRPDIAARLDAMELAVARTVRLKLSHYAEPIMDACGQVVECYANSNNHMLFRDTDLRGHAILARKSSNAMMATRIMLHMVKHYGVSPRRRQSALNPDPTNPPPSPSSSSSSSSASGRNPALPPNPNPQPPSPNSDLPTSDFPLPTSPSLPSLTACPGIIHFSLSPINNTPLPAYQAPATPRGTTLSKLNFEVSNSPSPAPLPAIDPTPATEAHSHPDPIDTCEPPLSNLESPVSNSPDSLPAPTSAIPHPNSDIPPDPSHPRSSVADSPRCAAGCTTCNCAPDPNSAIPHPKSDIAPDPRHPRSSAAVSASADAIPHRAREPTAP